MDIGHLLHELDNTGLDEYELLSKGGSALHLAGRFSGDSRGEVRSTLSSAGTLEVSEGFTEGYSLPQTCPKSAEPRKDIEIIESILASIDEYKGSRPSVQKVMHRTGSRVPSSVVTFVYYVNNVPHPGQLYVKHYADPELRKKDTVLPLFLGDPEIAIPSIRIVGFDPAHGDYEHEFAIFLPPSHAGSQVYNIFSQHTGIADLVTVAQAFSNEFVAGSLAPVAQDMLLRFAIKVYLNASLLKKRYGLELKAQSGHERMMQRLVQFLAADDARIPSFLRSYERLCAALPVVPALVGHNDATGANFRVGANLTDLYLLDFELTADTVPVTDDSAMVAVSLGAKMEGRTDAYRAISTSLLERYADRYNEICQEEETIPLGCERSALRIGFLKSTLEGHLFKIGDQVWLLDRGHGHDHEREERRSKARWHWSMMEAARDDLCACLSPDSRYCVKDFYTAGEEMLANNPKTSFVCGPRV